MYIVYLALSADSSVWSRLWNSRIPELLFNTVSLAVSVSAGTFVLGVSLAWLVVRYNFLGRQVWEWALVLPLAMPTYVLAYVYTYLLGAGGPVEQAWQIWAGPEGRVFAPHSYAGATLVMTLDTFPFVYLLTRAALLNFNLSYEEVARVCGASRLRRMLTVTLPLLRPAIVAGLSLVILYVVSDFGAVSLLRFQTFTYAVYQQITGRYDQTAAGVLSLLLGLFALIFLVIERWFRERSRFYQTNGRYRGPSRLSVLCLQAAYAGYVLPGPVGALALLVLFSHLAPFWYGTAVVLIVAYIVHFLPAGLQTMEPALQQVTPNLEEAASSLGLGPVRTFRETTMPLVRGGFVAAWVLMFLQCMKELPATLLLRPVGFDTLAVRVWLEASEEYYKLAAPSALLIVIMTLPALLLLVSKDWRAA